jgi:hypothetical protein
MKPEDPPKGAPCFACMRRMDRALPGDEVDEAVVFKVVAETGGMHWRGSELQECSGCGAFWVHSVVVRHRFIGKKVTTTTRRLSPAEAMRWQWGAAMAYVSTRKDALVAWAHAAVNHSDERAQVDGAAWIEDERILTP